MLVCRNGSLIPIYALRRAYVRKEQGTAMPNMCCLFRIQPNLRPTGKRGKERQNHLRQRSGLRPFA